jgi:FtsZ-binding cell division protein ZapB
LAVEFLDELERKVDILIKALAELRRENAALKEEAGKKSSGNSELEKENRSLKKDLQSREEKLKAAAERIQGLIAKIAV